MRITITAPLKSISVLSSPEKDLTFLPRDEISDQVLDRHLTGQEAPNIWIAQSKEVKYSQLKLWREAMPGEMLGIMVADLDSYAELKSLGGNYGIQVWPFDEKGVTDLPGVLETAEGMYQTLAAANSAELISRRRSDLSKGSVLLAGAGIVNLITAHALQRAGFRVRIADAGPDPRTCDDWSLLGVTSGGGNARMFTLTEADNYNEKGSDIYQNMFSIFRETARDGGWSVREPGTFSLPELAWVDAFESIPAWRARIYSENIFSLNRESGDLWQALRKDCPVLFQQVELCDDILRMYVETNAVGAAIELNRGLGALLRETNLNEFLADFPRFQAAREMNELAGGITVKGFTLNVHGFMARLIEDILGNGGEFLWETRVDGINRNANGVVQELNSGGLRLKADHYVISPGVGGNQLLAGTASENLIQGVLGVWLQIPNLKPELKNSIKIHRRGHLVEDINVTIAKDAKTGEDILIFGGGYGYVGLERPREDSPELAALFDELEEVARIYFPEGYAAAKARNSFYPQGRKYCIRPFTPNGLGVFEVLPAQENGLFIITGGHNTGGFAQSPVVARAVVNALAGQSDPMHLRFHPARGNHKLESVTRSQRTLS
ncbi:MAG: FAD-binding oxidoreductase [Bacteroidia bacterium]|nr:FAD-binding oxidoreductase [Bacteroidia bacterium]